MSQGQDTLDFTQALTCLQRRDLSGAESLLRAILKRTPAKLEALQLLGNIRHERGDSVEAVLLFEAALALAPGDVATRFNQALALAALKRHAEAVAGLDRVLAAAPRDGEALLARGVSLANLGRYAEAASSYRSTLSAGIVRSEVFVNLAAAHLQMDEAEAALDASERALGLAPQDARALFQRGAALLALGKAETAVAAFDQAVKRARETKNTRPVYEGKSIDEAGRAMRATAMAHASEFDAALELVDDVIRDYPNDAEHWVTRATIQTLSNRFEDAIASYDKALIFTPKAHEARFGRAALRLACGDLESGLDGFEARLEYRKSHDCRPSEAPMWTGRESIEGQSILVQGEQGYGDLFQFCRFVPILARRGARVVLHERPEVFSLLHGLEGIELLAPSKDAPPKTDWRIHLFDLMGALGVGWADLGASVPYLRADAERVSCWRQRLEVRSAPRIGLCWRGRAFNAVERMRPLDGSALDRLLAHDANFVSLQFAPGEDAGLLAARGVQDFGGEIADFAELAALIETLDLVVTIDTGVAHLAGALGKPVWIMLPYSADWRWMRDRTDSAWYPTARLFRQSAPGEWAGVIDAIKAQLPK